MPTTHKSIAHSPTRFSAEPFLVQPEAVAQWWPMARPLLAEAIKRSLGRCSFGTVHDALRRNERQLWLAIGGESIHAAVVTELVTTKTGFKFCRFVLMGGIELAKALPNLEPIERWARDQGCLACEVFGRRGWEPVLATEGYRPFAVSLQKEL